MSGRIYDIGINPICNLCGSTMYTSAQRNYNGPKCKRKGCDGTAIYEDFPKYTPPSVDSSTGEFILTGVFDQFKVLPKRYTIKERLRNFLFNLNDFLTNYGNGLR